MDEQQPTPQPPPVPGEVGTASGTDAEDTQPRERSAWGRRSLLVLLWSVVMIGVGASLAFEGLNRWAGTSAPTVELTIEPVTIDPAAPADLSPMPDVVGLTEEQALEALADIGLDPGRVTVEQRPWVGEVGRVVTQEPVRGTSDPAEVRLSLAEAVVTPDLAGFTSADARTALEELGIRAQVVEVAAPGVEPGTVVATAPGAGDPAESDTVVEVAARPSSIYLDALDPLEGSCREDAAEVGGRSLDRSVVCQLRANRTDASVSYQLNGDIERFEAVVGQSDRTDLGGTVAIQVVVDGEEVASTQLAFGESEELLVAVDGALRLTVTVLLVEDEEDEEEGGGSSVDEIDVVLGDARLIGPEPALDRLAGLE